MHLLTREAFRAYRRHLAPSGLLMVHISNRFLDLSPVVAAQESGGWTARVRAFAPDASEKRQWQTGSTWIAMSPSPATIARLVRRAARAMVASAAPGILRRGRTIMRASCR